MLKVWHEPGPDEACVGDESSVTTKRPTRVVDFVAVEPFAESVVLVVALASLLVVVAVESELATDSAICVEREKQKKSTKTQEQKQG